MMPISIVTKSHLADPISCRKSITISGEPNTATVSHDVIWINEMTESIIPVVIEKLDLLVDSRLIAKEMGVGHKNWLNNTVKKYQEEIENEFGILRFKNAKKTNKKSEKRG